MSRSNKRTKFDKLPINNTTLDHFLQPPELWGCPCGRAQTRPLKDDLCDGCFSQYFCGLRHEDGKIIDEVVSKNYRRFMLLFIEPASPSKERFIKMAKKMLNRKTANFRCFLHVLLGTKNKACQNCNHIALYRTLLAEYKYEVKMPFYYGKKQFIDNILNTMSKYVKKVTEIQYIEF